MKLFIIASFFIFLDNTFAVERISKIYVDRSKVNPIKINPGSDVVLRFPTLVEVVSVGKEEFFEREVLKNSGTDLILKLKESVNSASSLTIITSDGHILVFDLIPDSYNHQNVIYITGSFFPKTELSTKKIPENRSDHRRASLKFKVAKNRIKIKRQGDK